MWQSTMWTTMWGYTQLSPCHLQFQMTVVVVFLCFSLVASIDPELLLKHGRVRGTKVPIEESHVYRFLGLPFAQPPVGRLRFQKPQPHTTQWDLLDATRWPNICSQLPLIDNYVGVKHLTTASEDCLYLNIWSPVDPGNTDESKHKTVLVYIHGGKFVSGGSSHAMYDGAKLAKRADIVVVTINYRLGVLGFLYGNEEDAPGNVGLLDQVLALEWIQENIRYFGGNPKEVTISGQGAGSMSVNFHLFSPLSQHLFKRAYMMSGVAVDEFPSTAKVFALKNSKALVEVLGCKGVTSEELSQKEVECLRNVDHETIVNAQINEKVSTASGLPDFWPFRPIYGDSFAPQAPNYVFINRTVKSRDILLGTVVNEGYAYTMIDPNADLRPNLTMEESQKLIMEVARFWSISKIYLPKEVIENIYYAIFDDATRSFFQAVGDMMFRCPTIVAAEFLGHLNDVYHYEFAASVGKSIVCPKFAFQPCHLDDLMYLFGTLITHKRDVAASNAWINIVSKFVKGKTMPWPKYKNLNDRATKPCYKFIGPNESSLEFGVRQVQCSFSKDLVFGKNVSAQ